MIFKNKQPEIKIEFDATLVCIASKKNNAVAMTALFDALAQEQVNVDGISLIPSHPFWGGLSFSVYDCDFAKVLKSIAQLKQIYTPVDIEVCGGYTKIVLRGETFPQETGIVANFFKSMQKAGTEPALISSSDTTIAALIRTEELDKTVAALESFFPNAAVTYANS